VGVPETDTRNSGNKNTPSHTECSDSVRSRGCYSRSLESVCANIVVTHVVLLALMFGALHVAFRNILGVEALLFSWALGCCSTAGLGCCSAVATLLGWPLTADTCHFWASKHCWAVTAHCGHRCGHRRCETGSNSLPQFVSREPGRHGQELRMDTRGQTSHVWGS